MENQNVKSSNLEDNPIRTFGPRKKYPLEKHESQGQNPDNLDVQTTTGTGYDAREENQHVPL